jgi:hypothetical protein
MDTVDSAGEDFGVYHGGIVRRNASQDDNNTTMHQRFANKSMVITKATRRITKDRQPVHKYLLS